MDDHSLALVLGRCSTVLGVNKWREVNTFIWQPCLLVRVFSLALRTASTAGYKTLHVNLCNKTKRGDGECSSVSVFPHPVLSKEKRSEYSYILLLQKNRKWGWDAFFSRILFTCVSGKHGWCSMWMGKSIDVKLRNLKDLAGLWDVLFT